MIPLFRNLNTRFTSDLRPQTSDLRPQTSDLRPQTSDLSYKTSNSPQTLTMHPALDIPELYNNHGRKDFD